MEQLEFKAEGPGAQSYARRQREEELRRCRDVAAGTLHLRKRSSEYLPQFPKEDPDQYRARVDASVLFNYFSRTTGGLTGMVFRKPVSVPEELPEDIRADLSDVDRAGRDVSSFAHDVFEDAYTDGAAFIFVDLPPLPEGTTRDAFKTVRPYWFSISFEDFLGATTKRINGKETVISFRWRTRQVKTDPADRFKEVLVHGVREMRRVEVVPDDAAEGSAPEVRVEWEQWELEKSGKRGEAKWVSKETALLGRQMTEIPVSAAYTKRIEPFDAKPPLGDLAEENLRHFRKSSDKDNIEHVAAVPIFVTTGADEDDVKGFSVGPTTGLALPKDATAEYVETTGAGAEINANALRDSERRMAMLGLSQLFSDTKGPETATATRIEKSESDSQLSKAVDSLETAINEAIRFHAMWIGKKVPEGVRVTLNRDFENIPMSPQLLQALGQLVLEGNLSVETLWAMMIRGELLPENFDEKEELGRLERGDMDRVAALAGVLRPRGEEDDDEGEEDDE